MYPDLNWRSLSIETAVENVADRLVDRGLAQKKAGVSEAVLRKAEARLGRELPQELRVFYSRVAPVTTCPDDVEGGFVGFQPLEDPDLAWLDDPGLRKEKLWTMGDTPAGWDCARILLIGYTASGDFLLWCAGLAGRPEGSILLTDHEGEDNPIFLGDSFAQWLGRYAVFDLVE